jgi:hypothetical protein
VAGGLVVVALVVLATVAGLTGAGCAGGERHGPSAWPAYPPAPQIPRVLARGTLRGAPPPSSSSVELSMFLFGAEPPAKLVLLNPTGLAARGGESLICDSAVGELLCWNADTAQLHGVAADPPLDRPFAVGLTNDGGTLICDRSGVRRNDAAGRLQCRYTLADEPFKPAGALAVGEEVWVTNLAQHRVEVFAADTGAHLRSIGRHGSGPGEFALPRSLARTPDGNVCIVDVLNNRVQMLAPDGTWLRDIGQPGDNVGSFGRPKDVAVGPDGTIFVTDAFSQRVHAFAADGTVLLAFGEPDSGPNALVLPSGIAVSTVPPEHYTPLPPGEDVSYYVLVAEQLHDPGVRVYAWLDAAGRAEDAPLSSGIATHWQPQFPQSAAINPHWHPDRCDKCHKLEDGRRLPIPPQDVDAVCVSCHDGVQAFADPHPIGRPAVTDLVTTPDDWPTVDGRIGCLTCHDMERHCRPDAQRPDSNVVLLRHFDPQRALAYCETCHRTELGYRFSPHRQRDAQGKIREDACLFCHTQTPEVPADGRRRFEPHLRVESSALCLNCHSKHWDLSPLGHVDRPVTPHIREWMLKRELSLDTQITPAELARMAADPKRHPARLPLGENMVTCYTCHNPHYNGLFPPDSEVGALASNPQDRRSALRTDWIDLCSECHER